MNSASSDSPSGEPSSRAAPETSSRAGLQGRHAVVTGSSTGIGRAIALEFARQGARVLVHARRSASEGDTVVAEIRSGGGKADLCLADLRTDAGRSTLLDHARTTLGAVDIWVNNAGCDILTGEGAELSFEEKLEELWSLDVRATVLLARAAGAEMRRRGRGVILNLGWDQAATGMEGESGELFATTKGAVMSFTRSLALSLAPEVRVHCLAPGWIRTRWGETAPAAWQERVLRETPRGRWGAPEDVAKCAAFLASDDADFLTGQVWNINGGAVR